MPRVSGQALYLRMPNWVGDVCMSLPSLEALLTTRLPIIVCARPWAQDLLAAYPLAGFIPMRDAILTDSAAVRQHRAQGSLSPRGLLLPDSLSSALVFRLAGIPSSGYRDDGRSLLLRWPQRKPPPGLHATEAWHHLTRLSLQAWGLGAAPLLNNRQLGWRSLPEHQELARSALAKAGLAPQQFVLIAPTAIGRHKGKNKVWPGFDEMVRQLQHAGIAVAMAPPPNEQQAAIQAAPSAQLLPPMGLGAYTALTAMARLVICNDSGVSHLAAAAQARQLTLFGVTDPAKTGPWSDSAICLGEPGDWPALDEVLSAAFANLKISAGS